MVENKNTKIVDFEGLAKLVKSEVGGLAQMTAKGFAEVDVKFAAVHKKMDDEFDGIKARLTHIDNRLDIMADNHGVRLKRIEKHLDLAPLH